MNRRSQSTGARRTHQARGMLGALFALIAMAGLPAQVEAQSAASNAMITEQLDRIPTGDEGVRQIMTPMVDRLALNEGQVGEIEPIVSQLVENFESAKAKYEGGEYTVMKMMMEINAQGEQAATRIETHLTETQLAEYQNMRAEQKARMAEERRKAMQEMLKARQAAAAGTESAQ